jgi:hypothetical protein
MSAAPDILLAPGTIAQLPAPIPTSHTNQSNLLSLDLKMAMEDPQQQMDFNLNPIVPDTNYLNTLDHHTTDANYTKLENMSRNGSDPSTSHASYNPPTYDPNYHASVYDFPTSSYEPQTYSTEDGNNEEEETGSKKGEKSENKFLNVEQKKKFQEWIGQHSENLYPTRDEKLGLAKQLNASYLQVNFVIWEFENFLGSLKILFFGSVKYF